MGDFSFKLKGMSREVSPHGSSTTIKKMLSLKDIICCQFFSSNDYGDL